LEKIEKMSKNNKKTLPSVQLRVAKKEDADSVLQFIHELALYEKRSKEVKITLANIQEFMFEKKIAQAVIADMNGEDVGFAVYFHNFSTFIGRPGIYIEDLYVKEDFRKKGIGSLLFRFIADIAIQTGCATLEWTVLDWNTPSIEFYKKIGARPKDEWTIYRLSEIELNNIAKNRK
jgi:GNAT superfamily N-acetyltransferase